MVQLQHRSNRSPTGSRYKSSKTKPKHMMGRLPSLTKVEAKRRMVRIGVLGGREKLRQLAAAEINVFDPKTKKSKKAAMKTIVGNPANKNYVRRNILTKGAVVETDMGKVKITSRPGQNGSLDGILV